MQYKLKAKTMFHRLTNIFHLDLEGFLLFFIYLRNGGVGEELLKAFAQSCLFSVFLFVFRSFIFFALFELLMFVVLTFSSDVECLPDNPFFRDCSSFSVLSLCLLSYFFALFCSCFCSCFFSFHLLRG